MKTTFKLSALVLAMALTACSSSNSPSALIDKAKEAVDKVEDTAKETVSKVEDTAKDAVSKVEDTAKDAIDKVTPSTDGASAEIINYGGKHWSLINDRSTTGDLGQNTVNKLIVDGKEIDVYSLSPMYQEKNMQYNRFGFYSDPDISGESTIVYSFGQFTDADKIPTSGKATYKGSAIYGSEKLGSFVEAQSELSVDFGAKTVDGRVYSTSHNVNESFPTATITGNSFAGGSANTLQVRGNFFGTNAEEIGGVYDDDINGSVASFGAKKQ